MLCEHCHEREARKDRRRCNRCYRTTAGRARDEEILIKRRPPGLVDTGMRIDEEFGELITPAGFVPVPPGFTQKYYFESDNTGPRPVLRVLEFARRGKAASMVPCKSSSAA